MYVLRVLGLNLATLNWVTSECWSSLMTSLSLCSHHYFFVIRHSPPGGSPGDISYFPTILNCPVSSWPKYLFGEISYNKSCESLVRAREKIGRRRVGLSKLKKLLKRSGITSWNQSNKWRTIWTTWEFNCWPVIC